MIEKELLMPEFPKELQEKLEDFALNILESGRPGWDVPHTLAVVKWAYQLAIENNLDVKVLVSAAYLHDIGYYGQFSGTVAREVEVMDKKEKHMIVGAQMAREFLESEVMLNQLNEKQRERVVHLVAVHDKVAELAEMDELVLMEADSLGAIDVDWVKPTYVGQEALDYLDTRMIKRRQRFITKSGMQAYDELADQFKEFIRFRDFVNGDVSRWEDEGGMSC